MNAFSLLKLIISVTQMDKTNTMRLKVANNYF